jgi:beta-lactam-binding protein with PASTA domain
MGGERQLTTVPDVVGLEATAAAAAAVLAAELRPYGNYTPAPESGSITTQTPKPGASAAPGAPVILETGPGGGHGAAPQSPTPSGSDALTPA